jgi:hypothetical protein
MIELIHSTQYSSFRIMSNQLIISINKVIKLILKTRFYRKMNPVKFYLKFEKNQILKKIKIPKKSQ